MSTSEKPPVPGGKNVLVEFEDGIAWVSLNRPEKRNAMNPALAYEMLEVLEALEIDDRAGVLVLTGTGALHIAVRTPAILIFGAGELGAAAQLRPAGKAARKVRGPAVA